MEEAGRQNEEGRGMYPSPQPLFQPNQHPCLSPSPIPKKVVEMPFEKLKTQDVAGELRRLGLHPPPPTNGPVGGRIKQCLQNWKRLTNDPVVLEAVTGYKIEWAEKPPRKLDCFCPKFSEEETNQIDIEIQEMIQKRAIVQVTDPREIEYVSHLFLRKKKDGSFRPVFNLKSLNKHIGYQHFKMETIPMLKQLLQPKDYMIKIDLKDAYFCVPIATGTQKYLCFQWKGKTFKYLVCPFGLAPVPRLFTRLLKIPIGLLRKMGYRLMIFLDDLIILNQDPEKLKGQGVSALWLLQILGWKVNWTKSILRPCQVMDSYLGFIVNSIKMQLLLPQEKVENIRLSCINMLEQKQTSVRELAVLIGKLTATVSAILPAPLHYRTLQMLKRAGLKRSHQTYGAMVTLTPECREDLTWWCQNLSNVNGKAVISPNASVTITTDASKKGWGAVRNGTEMIAQGLWTQQESELHINVLELKQSC